jgi:hypothetical protein
VKARNCVIKPTSADRRSVGHATAVATIPMAYRG